MPGRTYESWEHAGGNGTIGLSTSGFPSRVILARMNLERPRMVTVQISRDLLTTAVADGASFDLFARVNWQVGRGTHTVDVDIGNGTAFTLAAAEAVEVQARIEATADSGTGNSAVLNCTLSPAAAINPVPAVRTQRVDLDNAGTSSGTLHIPTGARRVRFLSTSPNGLPATTFEFRTGGTTAKFVPPQSFDILNCCDGYRITNVAGNQITIWVIWELFL